MKNTIVFLIIYLCIACWNNLFAQQRYDYLNTWSPMISERGKELYIRLENYNFFENFEYESPNVKGYSLIGTWLRPVGEYYINNKLRIQIGLNLLKYYGRDKFDDISEWISIVYQPNNHIQILFGNLNNSSNFGLPAPLYDPSRFATNPDNKGLQFKVDYPWLNAQAWLEWEQFIRRNDDFQEIFTGGINGGFYFIDTSKVFSISLPISFLARHHGGEIDISEQKIETIINMSVGLKFSYNYNRWKFSITPQFLYFNEITKNYRQPITKGNAFYIQTDISYRQLFFGLDYWISENFFAPLGDPVFQSYSHYSPENVYKNNNLVNLHACWVHKILNSADLIIGGNFIYDVERNHFNYIAGIKFVLKPEFFCYKFKYRD